VLRLEGQGLLEVGDHVLRRGAGEAVHQIYGQLAEAGLSGGLEGAAGGGAVVAATEEAQPVVVEGLHPHAEPENAEPAERCEHLAGDVVRVDLHRDLAPRGQGEASADQGEEPLELVPRQDARRAAAHIDRVEGLEAVGPSDGFGLDGGEPSARLPPPFAGVEVTVGALGAAEGDVNVESRGACGHDSSVLSTATKARWGMTTLPTIFIRALPFFCFSRSLRFREMSPP